ncbi:MAG: 3D domain-containing protein [Firmicutes bacterium]|nr:3D domain-containing protein [Bacillota bacterium]
MDELLEKLMMTECVCHIYDMSNPDLLNFYKNHGDWGTAVNTAYGNDKTEVEAEMKKRGLLEGWGQHLATVAAAGIIGGAAVLGGAYKAAGERPVEPPASTVRAEEPKAEEPNEPTAKKEVVKMLVTAYCPCVKCCGTGSPGITANGHKIQPGDTFVAADKRYAFGTEMVIPGYNKGQPVKVLDRGGAIKGNHIDTFFPTHQEALNWGVQNLDVEILRD